jgi:hypothetical protein
MHDDMIIRELEILYGLERTELAIPDPAHFHYQGVIQTKEIDSLTLFISLKTSPTSLPLPFASIESY